MVVVALWVYNTSTLSKVISSGATNLNLAILFMGKPPEGRSPSI